MSKKSKDRLRDPTLQVTTRDHATYPSNFVGISVCTIAHNSRYLSKTSYRTMLTHALAVAIHNVCHTRIFNQRLSRIEVTLSFQVVTFFSAERRSAGNIIQPCDFTTFSILDSYFAVVKLHTANL